MPKKQEALLQHLMQLEQLIAICVLHHQVKGLSKFDFIALHGAKAWNSFQMQINLLKEQKEKSPALSRLMVRIFFPI